MFLIVPVSGYCFHFTFGISFLITGFNMFNYTSVMHNTRKHAQLENCLYTEPGQYLFYLNKDRFSSNSLKVASKAEQIGLSHTCTSPSDITLLNNLF